jgi:hypothetical protein
VWVTILSDHLPVIALVSRYLTNKLMGRELIPKRLAPFYTTGIPAASTSGISLRFQRLFPTSGQIVHVLLTLSRLPLRGVPLACLIHAASVHSEPGSNSPSLSPIAGGTFIGSSQAPWRLLQALFPSHSSLSPKLLSKPAFPLSRCSRLVCHISGGSIEYLQSSKRLGLEG